MPRGGFGNLIALPLQREPRALGNSVFLDPQLRPYPDDQQWSYLASLPRIDLATVDQIAREATDRGSVVGVQIATTEEEGAAPWAQPPSRKRSPLVVTEPLPKLVRAVLAQKLFVEKAGLPSPLINQIKRLAAFQNPEFYKKQSMRLSTALTPRVNTRGACIDVMPGSGRCGSSTMSTVMCRCSRGCSRSDSEHSGQSAMSASRCHSTTTIIMVS